MTSRVSNLQPVCTGVLALILAGLATGASRIQADEPKVVAQHTHEFRVIVDRKPRGTQSMTFQRRSDGSEVMRGEVEVVMNFIVYRYRYAASGAETWKDGRLIHLVNEADYNGDRYVTQASASEQALNYEVNGEMQSAPPDIWAASYWREPDPRWVGRKVLVLDSGKGRQLTAELVKLELETVKSDTDEIKATRYRMRGDVEVDVWYDRQGYIVRQESVESGHKTLLELTRIHKPAAEAAEERP